MNSLSIQINNEWDPLQCVAVVPPTHFRITDPINVTQQRFYGTNRAPNPTKLQRQHELIVSTLCTYGIDIASPATDIASPLQYNIRDVGVIIQNRIMVCNMHLQIRKNEPVFLANLLRARGVETICCIGHGVIEGGDVVCANENIFVGVSQRTDEDGVASLRSFVNGAANVVAIPLRSDVLHLDVALSLPSPSIAIVYLPAFCNGLPDELNSRDVIELTDAEYESQAANILPLRPDLAMIDKRQMRLSRELEQRGIALIPVELAELTKVGGGLRCMTLALRRGASETA